MKIKFIIIALLSTNSSLFSSELVYETEKIHINRNAIHNPKAFDEDEMKKWFETKKQLTIKHNYKIDFETLKKQFSSDIIKKILEFHWMTTSFLEQLDLYSITKIPYPLKIVANEDRNYFAIQCKEQLIILDFDNFKEISDQRPEYKEAIEEFEKIKTGTKLHVFKKDNRKFVLEMISVHFGGTHHKIYVKRYNGAIKAIQQMSLEQLEFFIDFAQRIWLTAYQLIEKNFDELAPRQLNYDQTKMFAALPEDILTALQNEPFEFEV